MSRSVRKPYDNFVMFSPKAQKEMRNLSRRLIRHKSKRNVKALIQNPDLPYEGVSFKDGYDEWSFPSDGHTKYIKAVGEVPSKPHITDEEWERHKAYRNSIMRK